MGQVALPSPGSYITQRIHHTTRAAIHEQLSQLWKPGWLASTPSTSDWDRIINFAQAYHFSLPSLSVRSWRRSTSRIKPQAARGADGHHKLDLINTQDHQLGGWQGQLANTALGGIGHRLGEDRSLPFGGPFSSSGPSFNDLPMLVILAGATAPGTARSLHLQDAHGFIPGREPAQIWLVLQSQIELSLKTFVGSHGCRNGLQQHQAGASFPVGRAHWSSFIGDTPLEILDSKCRISWAPPTYLTLDFRRAVL